MTSPLTVLERHRNPAIYAELIENGCMPVVADLLCRRLNASVSQRALYWPSLSEIPDPDGIPDMGRAVDRIVRAIVDGEQIALAVDHDMDGQACAAVLWIAFTQHFEVPPEKLSIVTSHRLTEGYGITDAVADRIIVSAATLVISADKGSSDELRIRRIAAAGKDVVVTDHHEVPIEGPPASAHACVNPARSDSTYDPYVCGAGVAFLTMAKVRSRLLELGHRREVKSLAALTDYVAVATIADCVALRPDRSSVNRAFIRSGLAAINKGSRPCWRVFRLSLRDEGAITSQSIAFFLAPAVAAAGRLDWADQGFRFLVADNEEDAERNWAVLIRENEERKRIEKEIRALAIESASKQSGNAIVVLIERGHSGVHGITASRLVERFGKPAVVFSSKGAGARSEDGSSSHGDQAVITGSFRSIDGLHIRDALQRVADRNPGMMTSFGGHSGAAGATLKRSSFDAFHAAFETSVSELTVGRNLNPIVWSDGVLAPQEICEQTANALAELDPWGKDFPQPSFTGDFVVRQCVPLGDQSHWRLTVVCDQRSIEAVWFGATEPGGDAPVQVGSSIRATYRLATKTYRGRRTVQLEFLAVEAQP